MENSFGDPVWFLWPVTFALLAGYPAGRLGRRGAPSSALVAGVVFVLSAGAGAGERVEDETPASSGAP